MHDSRARIWFALFVLVVFLLGGAGGFVVGRRLPPEFPGGLAGEFRDPEGRGRIGGPPFGRGAGGPGAPGLLPPAFARRLADEIGLDEAQRAQLRTVLDDHRKKFEDVHREARDRFEAEQRELHAAIRTILRPDQVQRFDRFINGRRP